MKTLIEIIQVDAENQKAIIIALRQDKIIVENLTLNKVQVWDIEDLKQCVKFI